MLFAIIGCAVVGFFLPIVPGGVVFIGAIAVLNGLLGWAQMVKRMEMAGRPVGNGIGFTSLAAIILLSAAQVAAGYFLGRGLAHLVG